MTVKVSLDISKPTAVTVNPTQKTVNNGNATVIWVPAEKDASFTFVGVTISPTGHFASPHISSPGDPVQMSVTELPPYGKGESFYYQLTVNSNGSDYQSAPIAMNAYKPGDPVIHNN